MKYTPKCLITRTSPRRATALKAYRYLPVSRYKQASTLPVLNPADFGGFVDEQNVLISDGRFASELDKLSRTHFSRWFEFSFDRLQSGKFSNLSCHDNDGSVVKNSSVCGSILNDVKIASDMELLVKGDEDSYLANCPTNFDIVL